MLILIYEYALIEQSNISKMRAVYKNVNYRNSRNKFDGPVT